MKKIISALLAAVIVSISGFSAFASNLNDIYESEKQKQEGQTPAEDEGQTEQGNGAFVGLPTILTPTDMLYDSFIKTLEMYVKEHLYDFTQEDVLYKFIYDMIAQHPEFYEMMLNTLLGTMDPYSAYHEKDSGFLSLESQSAGYGIVVSDSEDGITIKSVTKQSEAEKAGLLPGDVITGVCGYDITALSWTAVSMLLKRPYIYFFERNAEGKFDDYNPVISITVDRNGTPLVFELKKGLVITDELSTEYMEMDDKQVAYIAISGFISEDLSVRFKSELEKIQKDGYTKLVIDLRNNGGGSLLLAIEMAELFVENGETMCYYNSKTTDEPMAIISDNDKFTFDSISVLINENTASAAELMANILKTKADAVLVGKKSFGKAIGQTVYNLVSGNYITITTYEILDVNKETYNGVGLIPDLELDNVEILYELPALEVFNHINYKEIINGVYSEPCLALEKRLGVLGLLRDPYIDGVWDNSTSLAIFVLQRTYFTSGATGSLDDNTVTLITDLINDCKDDTYIEDSQLDCALLYHSSFDQSKRLIKEKERLAKKQAELIEENNKKLEEQAELDD